MQKNTLLLYANRYLLTLHHETMRISSTKCFLSLNFAYTFTRNLSIIKLSNILQMKISCGSYNVYCLRALSPNIQSTLSMLRPTSLLSLSLSSTKLSYEKLSDPQKRVCNWVQLFSRTVPNPTYYSGLTAAAAEFRRNYSYRATGNPLGVFRETVGPEYRTKAFLVEYCTVILC
jgi:hypothetical protein